MDLSKRLIFGAPDPRLEFRSSPDGIRRLCSSEEIQLDDPYWKTYYTLFDSAVDVFTLVQPSDIRNALTQQPKNISNLVTVLSQHMFDLLQNDCFPEPNAESFASSASNWASSFTSAFKKTAEKESAQSSANTTRQMLSCLRVLSRILPFVFELSDNGLFQRKLFFTQKYVPNVEEPASAQDSDASHFVIEDDDDEGDASSTKDPLDAQTEPPQQQLKPMKALPCLGELLLQHVVKLLFCPGFTIPTDLANASHAESKINYAIWEAGIGASIGSGSTRQLKANRCEVLRLLQVLLSNKTVYADPEIVPSAESTSAYNNSFQNILNTAVPRKTILALFCSLVNTSLKRSSENVFSAGEKVVFRRENVDANLTTMTIQTLAVCLVGETSISSLSSSTTTQSESSNNQFLSSLSKLHRPSDLLLLFHKIIDLLSVNAHGNVFTAALPVALPDLPQGARAPKPQAMSPPGVIESLVLFWKMWDVNPKFQACVLEDGPKITEFLVYLLFNCLEAKDDSAKHGLLRLCTFILQTITSKKELAVQLNSPAVLTGAYLRSKYNISGTYNDFLVQSLYTLIFSSHNTLTSVYPSFVLTIQNISPFVKKLSVKSSARLVQLFVSLSNPACLISDDDAPRIVNWMLEAFNNIIHYGMSDNPNFTYAILRSSGRFQTLASFTLQSALRDIELAKQHKLQTRRNARHSRSNSEASTTNDDKTASRTSTGSGNAADTSLGSVSLFDAEEENTSTISLNTMSENGVVGVGPQRGDPDEQPVIPMSEKARGKMREIVPPEMGPDDNSNMETPSTAETPRWISKNGFIPTETWVASWREGLPLDTILVLISELHSTVSKLLATSKHNGNNAAIDYLKDADLSKVLPPCPPIKSRPFLPSRNSEIWLEGLVWGLVYISGAEQQLPLFVGTNVRLFSVMQKGQSELFKSAVTRVKSFLSV